MAAAGQETEEASKIPLVYVSILLTGAQQLKSALWYSMGQIVDHETLQQGSNATPQFIGALTEMVWSQIESVAKDLEAFAKHANRSQINADDVMLLARRNEGLEALLRRFLDDYRRDNGTAAKSRARK